MRAGLVWRLRAKQRDTIGPAILDGSIFGRWYNRQLPD
jgi:hypothetical protein